MRRTIANIMFICITALFLCGVFEYAFIDKVAGGAIEQRNSSDLEAREYHVLSELTLDGVPTGKTQELIDKYLSDRIPFRDKALIVNAQIQRIMIEIANSAINYDSYPSFFDSDQAYSRSSKTVFEIPSKQSQPDQYAERITETIAPLISNNPGVKWAFFFPDRNNISEASPLNGLVSGVSIYTDYARAIDGALPETCKLIDIHYTDTDEYARDYFHTDHHMQIQGAVRLHDEVMRYFEKGAKDFSDYFIAYRGRFLGSNARWGIIDLASDVIYDVKYSPSNLIIYIDNSEKQLNNLDKTYDSNVSGDDDRDPYSDVHSYWFHPNFGIIEYDNPSLSESEGSLLIIGDSYSNNAGRLYAESYRHVYEIDPRYYTEMTIQSFINSHDIDDALFILSLESISDSNINSAFDISKQ